MDDDDFMEMYYYFSQSVNIFNDSRDPTNRDDNFKKLLFLNESVKNFRTIVDKSKSKLNSNIYKNICNNLDNFINANSSKKVRLDNLKENVNQSGGKKNKNNSQNQKGGGKMSYVAFELLSLALLPIIFFGSFVEAIFFRTEFFLQLDERITNMTLDY